MLARIAVKNTLKNWRHSLSALLSLGASFVSLVLFDGYMANVDTVFYNQFRHQQMLGDVMIENKNLFSKEGVSEPEKFWLSKEEQDAIQKFADRHKEQVHSSARTLDFQGMLTNGQQSQIFLGRGYDIKQGAEMRGPDFEWNATYGLPLHKVTDPYTAGTGKGLSERLGCTFKYNKNFTNQIGGFLPEDRPFECPTRDLQVSATTVDGQLNAVDLTIVGTIDGGYKDLDDRVLHTSLEASQTLMGTDRISYTAIELKPHASVSDFMAAFDQEVVPQFPNLHIIRWEKHRFGEIYTTTMDFLSIFRNFIIIVILVVSTMSVVNTLVKIVKERTREIGTLRSIGFRSREVAIMFLYESILLAMIGSFFGLILSVLLTAGLNSMQIMYKAGMLANAIPFHIDFVPKGYLTAWILLVVVSVLASYFSTLSILKSKIVDNLIHA